MYPARDDFNLLTTEITLRRDFLQGFVAIQVPHDGLDNDDAPFESFSLELGDPLGLVPPNIVLKNTIITIKNVGKLLPLDLLNMDCRRKTQNIHIW